MLPKPLKKSNEKATQKRKANKGQPTNPKIVSLCQQPTLEGLNHFALNWAFNEPKSGELGVNSVVDHVDGGGGELDDFRLADGEKKLFDPKWKHCPSGKWSNKQQKYYNYNLDLTSKDWLLRFFCLGQFATAIFFILLQRFCFVMVPFWLQYTVVYQGSCFLPQRIRELKKSWFVVV